MDHWGPPTIRKHRERRRNSPDPTVPRRLSRAGTSARSWKECVPAQHRAGRSLLKEVEKVGSAASTAPASLAERVNRSDEQLASSSSRYKSRAACRSDKNTDKISARHLHRSIKEPTHIRPENHLHVGTQLDVNFQSFHYTECRRISRRAPQAAARATRAREPAVALSVACGAVSKTEL